MFVAQLYRLPRAERARRVSEMLEVFGLAEQKNVKAQAFSKGMRRRLSIAMAIIHRPNLLFLDEPTPGLDAQSTRAIRDLVRQLSAQGTTIFLTTHQIEEANQLCDRVAIINHGQIVAIDTPEQLKAAFSRVQSVEVALQPASGSELAGGGGSQLSALAGVKKAVKMGDKWRLYTNDPATLLPLVISYAQNQGLRVVSLCTLGPSLEDVFLEITGQQMSTVPRRTQEDRSQAARRR